MRAEYRDDLRRLRERADRDPERIRELLTGFPRLGPVGAQIFCREAQAVWPELRPALDGKALDGARALGLPADPDALAEQVRPGELAVLAAALVRVALDKELARGPGRMSTTARGRRAPGRAHPTVRQKKCRRPPTARPVLPRMSRMTPTTSRMPPR